MSFSKIINTLKLEYAGTYEHSWLLYRDKINYLIIDTENYMLKKKLLMKPKDFRAGAVLRSSTVYRHFKFMDTPLCSEYYIRHINSASLHVRILQDMFFMKLITDARHNHSTPQSRDTLYGYFRQSKEGIDNIITDTENYMLQDIR